MEMLIHSHVTMLCTCQQKATVDQLVQCIVHSVKPLHIMRASSAVRQSHLTELRKGTATALHLHIRTEAIQSQQTGHA